MKIGDARHIYSGQIQEFRNKKLSLAKQKEELAAKASLMGNEAYANEAATLELSYQAVTEKYDEYRDFMGKIMNAHMTYFNAEATKQQSEALKEYGEDMAKIMEVARRISQGGRVPASDEKKLMEFSMEMYMAAKNMAMLKELKEREDYDSLWEEEEAPTENPDPNDVANDAELSLDGPEVLDVDDVIASATASADLPVS